MAGRDTDASAGEGVSAPLPMLSIRALEGALRRTVLLVVTLFLAYRLAAPLSGVLLLFLLATILAAVLTPAASLLERWRIPRFATAIVLVLGSGGLLLFLAWLTVPTVCRDVYGFASQLNFGQLSLKDRLQRLWSDYPLLAELLPPPQAFLQSLAPDPALVLRWLTRAVFGSFTAVLSVLVLAVLVVHAVGRPVPLLAGWLAAIPPRYRPAWSVIISDSIEQLKHWALGTFVLALIVGGVTGAGLWLVGKLTGHPFPYLLLFSIIAALGEVIPIVGPILSAVPPTLIALTIDPMLAGWVLLLFLIIQQTENNIIVPLVMSKSVDLHPFSLIFVLMVMQSLFGIVGAFLATPVALIARICWRELYLRPAATDTEALKQDARTIVDGAPAVNGKVA